jgi:hypothetical protein
MTFIASGYWIHPVSIDLDISNLISQAIESLQISENRAAEATF